MPRLLAIGDIHGCLTALDTLLGFIELADDDRIVFLGDYVDRGPDSKGVIDRLIGLHRQGRAVCLRGNHEIMMLAAREGRDDFRFWMTFGGLEALESYSSPGRGLSFDNVPESHWDFIRRTCVDWHATEAHNFVHASLHPDLPLEQQTTDTLHWQALSAQWHRPHCSGKTTICGHTQQPSGIPLRLMRAVCIDTGACNADGWLTCLDVETEQYWQANEFGQTREGIL